MPQQFDVIVSNPPWLPASYVQAESTLENAIYDPQSLFLFSVLNFSSKQYGLYCREISKLGGEVAADLLRSRSQTRLT